MIINDIGKYRKAKKELDKLNHLIPELDKVVDILYNNLEYSGVWKLLNVVEETRVHYYMKRHEYNRIIRSKGIINHEKS